MADSPGVSEAPTLEITGSRSLPAWLETQGVSLAFTTYQAGKLFFVGSQNNGRLSIFERTFARSMGLWANDQTMWMSSLYQLWRFVTPGLHKHERRSAYIFVAVSLPLFMCGVVLAYIFLPKGLNLLFGFTPENVGNYVEVSKYLSFFLRTVFVFGLAFLTPVILVGLNLVGVLSGKRLASWWRGIIFAVFIFAAVATPSGDPISMLVLAGPVLGLVALAILVCMLNDRRRARNNPEADYDQWSDDEASPFPDREDPPLDSPHGES